MRVSTFYKKLPWLVLAAGGIGLVLRLWLLGSTDSRGFLLVNPVAEFLLWLVAAAVPALLFYLTRSLQGARKYLFNFPASPVAGIGIALGALGIILHSMIGLWGPQDTIDLICNVLGIFSAVCLGLTAWSRIQGRRPNFLLHVIVAVYLMLRLICQYRHWSADPQLLDYCFQLLATICLMMAVYHRSAFDAEIGNRKGYAFFSLTTLFFCCLCLTNWGDTLFYFSIGVWMFTDLCSLKPMRNRRRAL